MTGQMKTGRTPVRQLALILLLLCSYFDLNAQDRFDHFSTGFDLNGAHAGVGCDGCHVGGTFTAANRVCVACHSQAGLVRASMKPLDHVQTSETCDDCHTTAAWSPIAYMDHVSVSGNCGSCHNGFAATGKTPEHITSGNNCDDCHISVAWVPARFDHANIAGNCFSCHNGIDATGKDLAHVQTTNICEDCHNNVVWSPADRVDHTQVLGSCSSCHNGVTATGKNPTHISSGDNCDDCHTTVAWTPATFDHATITGNCSGCHNGTDATGKDPGHFVTVQECNICHTSTEWLPHTFMHTGLLYEPLDHRGNLECTDCHQANTEVVNYPSPAYQPDCAGCHANDFRSGPHKKHENPDVTYNVGELRDCTGACHIYEDASLSTIKDRRNGPEHRISEGEF